MGPSFWGRWEEGTQGSTGTQHDHGGLKCRNPCFLSSFWDPQKHFISEYGMASLWTICACEIT